MVLVLVRATPFDHTCDRSQSPWAWVWGAADICKSWRFNGPRLRHWLRQSARSFGDLGIGCCSPFVPRDHTIHVHPDLSPKWRTCTFQFSAFSQFHQIHPPFHGDQTFIARHDTQVPCAQMATHQNLLDLLNFLYYSPCLIRQWSLCSDLVDPKVGMQVLNDVHTTRCQGVPQGKQAEEHLASCTGTVVDDDVPGSLGNQGIHGIFRGSVAVRNT
mmetsp:Transcript_65499/g.143662  ORF Transcript_65499/g.143662 Transcript_65499/m.143662 type:complete len:215 (-) Transcript_65499:622-1266(-)